MNSRKQSIIITGISGSGKTRTSSSIIDFLCQVTKMGDCVKFRVLNSGPILEAFGNAKTTHNLNSSRFCKYTEVLIFIVYHNMVLIMGLWKYLEKTRSWCSFFWFQLFYGPNSELVGGRVLYHFLEANRVCCKDPGQSNFHIFYSLLFGAPETLLEQLLLGDDQRLFSVS